MVQSKLKGWGVVVATWFCLFVGASPVIVFTFGNFLKPLGEEFGWNRGFMSTGLAAGAIAAAIAAPFLGRLIDRFGLRTVTLPALLLAAAAVAAQSLNNGNGALLFIIQVFAGGLTVSLTALPYSKAITTWFDHNRGLALGLSTLGGAIGVAVVPQIAQHVIAIYGWRAAYLSLGGMIVLFAFLPACFLLWESPKDNSLNEVTSVTGLTAAEGRRDWRLWTLCVAFLLAAAGVSGVVGQLVPLLTDRGFPIEMATGTLAYFAISSAIARISTGLLLDRVFAPVLGAVVFCTGAIGIIVIAVATSQELLILGVILCGVAVGAEYDLLPFVISRYVGTRAYGELVGYGFLSFTLGTGTLGPLVMGNAFSILGSYTPALIVFSIFLGMSAVLLLCIGRYRFVPEQPVAVS